MVFLRSTLGHDPVPIVRGTNVWMRLPVAADYASWGELRSLSRDHLSPWEPAWARDELTRSAFRRRLRHYNREAHDDLGYAFFIFDNEDDALLGGITLSNLRRGVTQAASLGYWLGLPYVGRGRMSDAVSAMIPFAFGQLRLHRIEAASIPSNQPSIRVLERSGFEREGLARQYLKINGHWSDHILFGLVEPGVEARKERG